jgi:hypothetical protein
MANPFDAWILDVKLGSLPLIKTNLSPSKDFLYTQTSEVAFLALVNLFLSSIPPRVIYC